LKFAEHNLPVRRVVDDTRLGAVEANKAKAAQDLFGREETGQLFLVAQTILECDHGSVRTDQRRQQFPELIVGRGLKPNQNDVARSDFIRRPGAPGLNVKIPINTVDGHALSPHDVVVGPQQEVHFLPAPAELGTIETAQRTAADNANFHYKKSVVSG
jgi:hypothetical protein